MGRTQTQTRQTDPGDSKAQPSPECLPVVHKCVCVCVCDAEVVGGCGCWRGTHELGTRTHNNNTSELHPPTFAHAMRNHSDTVPMYHLTQSLHSRSMLE